MTTCSHRQGRRLQRFLRVALLLATAAALWPVQASAATTAEILAVWRQRQQAISCARLAWNAERIVPSGAFTRDQPTDGIYAKRKPNDPTFPQGDVTLHSQWQMVFDKQSERIDRREDFLTPKSNAIVSRQRVDVWTGGVNRKYFGDEWYKKGGIYPENHQRGLLDVKPVWIHYRFDWLIGAPAGALRMTPHPGSVNGQECAILALDRNDRQETYWVDPRQEWAVVRHTIAYKGRESARIDLSYKRDAGGHLVLAGWRTVQNNGGGQVRETTVAKIIETELNPTLATDQFAFSFPPDTLVVDMTEGAATGGRKYISRADGSKRIVERREWNADYSRLVATESGGAVAGATQGAPWWPWLLAGVVFLLLAWMYSARVSRQLSD